MVSPVLIKQETFPAKVTYYLSIDLGSGNRSQKALTGVYIPDNYVASDRVDVILWLMGYHRDAIYPANLGVDDYFKNYASFKFREFVNSGRKNVILVAPTLGPESEAGKLTGSNGLAWYLDQILDFLPAAEGFQSRPALGNLVIACHSGGGYPMRLIATTQQTYLANVKEFWGFDCLYMGDDEAVWMKWATTNGVGKKLLIRYGAGKTDKRSVNLKSLAAKVANIDVDGVAQTPHGDVPSKYWLSFMRAASFLIDTGADEPYL